MQTTSFLGELMGTMMLILLGNGVVANVLLNKSKGQNAGWMVITAGWGIAVMVGIFVAQKFGSPDAHLNPAVTIAAAITKRDASCIIPYICAQMIGAFLGSCLVYLAYLAHWKETEDPGLKLAVFCNAPAIRNPIANVITEIIGTLVLIFAANSITSTGGLTPYLVGMLVWGIGLSLGGPTGYAINPARDLAPRIAHFLLPIPGKGDSDWQYAWIPVVAPIIAAIIAGLVFAQIV